jgi:hypothetical protein
VYVDEGHRQQKGLKVDQIDFERWVGNQPKKSSKFIVNKVASILFSSFSWFSSQNCDLPQRHARKTHKTTRNPFTFSSYHGKINTLLETILSFFATKSKKKQQAFCDII